MTSRYCLILLTRAVKYLPESWKWRWLAKIQNIYPNKQALNMYNYYSTALYTLLYNTFRAGHAIVLFFFFLINDFFYRNSLDMFTIIEMIVFVLNAVIMLNMIFHNLHHSGWTLYHLWTRSSNYSDIFISSFFSFFFF